MEITFWKDDFEGQAKFGCFFRSNLGKDIAEIQDKIKGDIVGIKVDTDSWNLEFITTKDQQ
jgi:hypothetical protein|tara:strand:- start:236 stop:418 length:183 start_codon:yes stop_codon:yes gene_type:complete